MSESVNNFLADPVNNNPLAAVGKYYKDIAKASYSGDWETVANKVGSGTATVAVMGITGTLAEGAAGKIFSKGISIDKSISLPMLEMYEYAGAGGFELGVSTVSIPIKASVSASKVATAAGVTASAAAGQGIYYSNKFYNQSSGGGVSNSKIDSQSHEEAHNVARYEKFKKTLETTESANGIMENLRTKGKLPSNYVTKAEAMSKGWKPGKALDNYVSGGQLGGDVFQNSTGVLPQVEGRVWYEADIGIKSTISRAKQAGTRLVYSNDGLAYVTYDHYTTVHSIGKWK